MSRVVVRFRRRGTAPSGRWSRAARWVLGSTLACLSTLGCGESEPVAEAQAGTTAESATASASSGAAAAEPSPSDVEAWNKCGERIAQLKAEPALPGAPLFEERRVHMARVRGKGLLFRRAPEGDTAALDDVVKRNEAYDKLVQGVRNVLRKAKPRERRREVALREGYLWADDVQLALALVEQVSLPDLYQTETLFLERGVDVYELSYEKRTRKRKLRYEYVDGPYAGETAEILFGDRVAESRAALADKPTLAIDLSDAQDRYFFDRIRPVHLTEKALVAELRWGSDTWVPSVLELEGARATLSCEALDAERASRKNAYLHGSEVLRKAMGQVRAVVRNMVREEIPFDADADQSNGFLRKAWKRSYFQGWRRFHFGDKSRDVYTLQGQPMPPQVCIDFLTDTWERASGTWYVPAKIDGKKMETSPKRTEGAIDFDKLDVGNRRSVADFTKYTLEHPELFDVWALPKEERIAFRERDAFFDYLGKRADMFQPGDMLTIHGFKEGGRPHYHSIIVLETDPITGVPTLVAGNAVFPREQTLEGVMHISPHRTFRHRIRVKEPWLEAVAAQVGK